MIGLFDSGIGGLTVLNSLQKALPQENFIYLGDTARLPYGTKSPETIKRYTQQNIHFLKKRGVNLVVSACHSASSSILLFNITDTLPILNVIEPSCIEAQKKSKTKKIGLMATQATVDGGQYKKLIQAPYDLVSQACPLLVPLVESGWTEDPITLAVIERYTRPLLEKNVDVIILGCTHFPILKPLIQKVVGDNITLIDPGETMVPLVKSFLKSTPQQQSSLQIYLTDQSPHFVQLAEKILTRSQLKITQVDLEPLS